MTGLVLVFVIAGLGFLYALARLVRRKPPCVICGQPAAVSARWMLDGGMYLEFCEAHCPTAR